MFCAQTQETSEPADLLELHAELHDAEEEEEEEVEERLALLASPDSGKSTDYEGALSPVKPRSETNGGASDPEDCEHLRAAGHPMYQRRPIAIVSVTLSSDFFSLCVFGHELREDASH